MKVKYLPTVVLVSFLLVLSLTLVTVNDNARRELE